MEFEKGISSFRFSIIHVLSGDLWAGAEVMAFHLLNALSDMQNCELLVVVLNEGHFSERLREKGIKVAILEESRLSFPRLLLRLRKILCDFKPDIIHSHRYKENILAYLASKGMPGVSLVSTQHGMPERQTKRPSLKNRLKYWTDFYLLSKHFDSLVAVSWEMRDLLIAEKGVDSKKISVIHNGIDISQHVEEISKFENNNGQYVIGSSGRLFSVKNYSMFINLAKRLTAYSPKTRFELAGDGPQMEQLRIKCHQKRLDENFAFLGHVRDMRAFYQGLNIYVCTSIHEGIPMSILEAMGYGLPVVAPRVGGLPEIIDHGVDGFLIPEHDPELFAQACLNLQADSELLNQMSKAAREKIQTKFSEQKMAIEYYNLYQDLVNKRC